MIEEIETKDTLVGTFQNNKSFGFVVPDNKKLYGDIFISKKNFGKARNNHKVLVKIIKQANKDQKAEGKIIEVLGGVNEAGVDMLSLIKEYNLPAEFPKPVVLEAKSKPKKVQEKDLKYRKDLREDLVFTIDGEDAKDLDDAVCVTKKENGNYILDVHIADVSHYIGEGSELDKEALIRGTSIYMLGRVIPMLPRELSNGICSLNEGEDRLTLSCTMEIDKQGKVIDSEIYKAVIRVTKRMSYHDVQTILDYSNKEKKKESDIRDNQTINEEKYITKSEEELEAKVVEKYKEYIPNFKLMEELALILKERRKEQGYLNLDIPESKIDLNIDGKVINISKYETTFANEIIEQFMLIANETVAEKFYWLQAPFIYRVHEEPDLDKTRELNGFLYNFGLRIKIVNEKVYPNEFAKALEKVKGTEEEKVVANLILRTLKVARYEAQNKGHFGIASKYYCHFTSPIRRYPDLFIHRIISKYLKDNYNVKENFIDEYKERAESRASQSSEREKIATKVERESEKIKKAEFMQDKIGEVYEGIISSVTNFGIFVELENTVEGLVKFENISDEYFIFDENRRMLIGEKTRETYKIGDKVTVRVISASKALRQVDFEIVKNDQLVLGEN